MPNTTHLNIPYPDSSGSTRLWEHFQALAVGVDNAIGDPTGIPHVYASAAARDAAIPTPSAGMHAFTVDTTEDWVYDGSAWKHASCYYVTSPTAMIRLGSRYLAWGTTVGTTNGSGDFNLASGIRTATGWTNVETALVTNGDAIARANTTFGWTSNPPWSGTGNVRIFDAASGGVVAGLAFRFNWQAVGS